MVSSTEFYVALFAALISVSCLIIAIVLKIRKQWGRVCILPEETASFDVDPQKGFTPLCPNELPVVGGDTIVGALNQQAEFAKYRVVSKDAHSPGSLWEATAEKPQFSVIEGNHPNVDIRWNRHCEIGTRGGELLDGLPKLTDYDFVVWKGMEPDMHPYGACYHDLGDKMSTGVIEYLRAKNVKTVIVGGLATDYCVHKTVMQLYAAGFRVILNLEACRGIAPDSVAKALEEMQARYNRWAGGANIIVAQSLSKFLAV